MIDSNRILEIFKDCLYKDEEVVNGQPIIPSINVEGIMNKYGLHPIRLEGHKDEITSLVNELNPTFNEGWSFLNLCLDKENNQWTGSHHTMEILMVLALAINKFEYLFPREDWDMLPGSMPYIKII